MTSTLKFNFFVLKFPVRPPTMVAKQVRSLSALIGNRMGLDVSTTPYSENYELMGTPFAKRGKLIDEYSEIVHGLNSGNYFEFYNIPNTKMNPVPTQPIPILVGGHADTTLRCAGSLDGWM